MQRVYFDNAATTRLDPAVLEAMLPLMQDNFGNPSSIHGHGRVVRSAIEKARKTVASLLNAAPAEIVFTSGGTEADNMAITGSIDTYGLTHAITSPLEHHAVLHTLQHLAHAGKIKLDLVEVDAHGRINYDHLEALLQTGAAMGGTLVSLMHGNNEIGNLLDMGRVGTLRKQYNAVWHCDTVQTMGHYRHNVQELNVDFLVGAAHKFHGPKGVGFLYARPTDRKPIQPFIHGGSQERNRRGGTENVYGIVGLAKALEIAYAEMEAHRRHIESLKQRMIDQLRAQFDERAGGPVLFNGDSADLDKSLYTVLSVSLPPSDINDMLLFNLDIAGISVSGGSACSSGTDVGSHVLNALPGIDPNRANVRFSFGKYNTIEEVDYAVAKVAELYAGVNV
ncbi:cysteine desulfurase family protein [Fibrella sp. WM1]|uniref:cysteine desulfurase family protein n=1 Tax=Fibrella musci TaxID=3242485 RepID=UPI003520B4D3